MEALVRRAGLSRLRRCRTACGYGLDSKTATAGYTALCLPLLLCYLLTKELTNNPPPPFASPAPPIVLAWVKGSLYSLFAPLTLCANGSGDRGGKSAGRKGGYYDDGSKKLCTGRRVSLGTSGEQQMGYLSPSKKSNARRRNRADHPDFRRNPAFRDGSRVVGR